MPKHKTDKSAGAIVISALLIGVVLALAWPIVVALGSAMRSADADAFAGWLTVSRGWMLVRSVGIAAAIGAGALVLGLPIAAILGSGRRGVAVLLAPIWMPSILVYAALNLLRSPETIAGRMLVDMAGNGHRWAPIWAGYLIAAIGLALWASPIAGVLIAAGRSDQSAALGEQLAVEPVGWMTKCRLWIGARRGELFRAWGILTVIFLGSAVPMHLAQFDTWSIVLWRELSQRGPDDWATVWIGSTPMLLAACVGAWMVLRTIGDITTSPTLTASTSPARVRLPRVVGVLAWGIWALAVVVPMVAMVWSLDDLGSIAEFWRVQGGAFWASSGVAIIAGLFAITVAVAVAYTLGHPSSMVRKIGKSNVFVLAAFGLAPGVLVGASVAQSSIEGYSAVVLAACIRTAWIGAIVGAIVGAGEPGARRAMRWMDGSIGVLAWMRTTLMAVWMPLVGGGVAAGLVALYEIEASVMVRPPGMENLPQQLLSDLHYTRLERLSGAGVNLLGIGVLVGAVAMVCMVGFGRTKSNQSRLGE